MIFDFNMAFNRKACFFYGGHHTEPPASATYVSVVCRDSLCAAPLLSALNDVNVIITCIQGMRCVRRRCGSGLEHNLDHGRYLPFLLSDTCIG